MHVVALNVVYYVFASCVRLATTITQLFGPTGMNSSDASLRSSVSLEDMSMEWKFAKP